MDAFFDRRLFLLGATMSGSSWLSACKTTGQSAVATETGTAEETKPSPRVRRRWETGKDHDFQKQYIKAVEWLKANDNEKFPDEDPRSYLTWNRLVAIHNESCPHGNWYLLPWHRFFVNYFELACQFALQDPNFALPYWDWTLDPALPLEFYDNPILNVEQRRLKRGESIREGSVGQETLDRTMGTDDFYSFHSRPEDYRSRIRGPAGAAGSGTGQFEAGPHNNVHNTIGGPMANNSSPTDPIFWLHHSNVERLWLLWQERHPQSRRPYKIDSQFGSLLGGSMISTQDDVADVWENNVLKLNHAKDKLQPDLVYKRTMKSQQTVKELTDDSQLDYNYDTTPPKLMVTVHKKQVVQAVKRQSSQIVGTRDRGAGSLKVTLNADAFSRSLQQFVQAPKSMASFLALNLKAPADAEAQRTLEIRFFILKDDETAEQAAFLKDDAFRTSAFVGSYSFFGHHHPGAVSNTQFDISAWLRKNADAAKARKLVLLALAVDVKNKKGMAFFKDSPEAELLLQLDLVKV